MIFEDLPEQSPDFLSGGDGMVWSITSISFFE